MRHVLTASCELCGRYRVPDSNHSFLRSPLFTPSIRPHWLVGALSPVRALSMCGNAPTHQWERPGSAAALPSRPLEPFVS